MLSADRSNSKTDFCGKGPLFLEQVTYVTESEKMWHIHYYTRGYAWIATCRPYNSCAAAVTSTLYFPPRKNVCDWLDHCFSLSTEMYVCNHGTLPTQSHDRMYRANGRSREPSRCCSARSMLVAPQVVFHFGM